LLKRFDPFVEDYNRTMNVIDHYYDHYKSALVDKGPEEWKYHNDNLMEKDKAVC